MKISPSLISLLCSFFHCWSCYSYFIKFQDNVYFESLLKLRRIIISQCLLGLKNSKWKLDLKNSKMQKLQAVSEVCYGKGVTKKVSNLLFPWKVRLHVRLGSKYASIMWTHKFHFSVELQATSYNYNVWKFWMYFSVACRGLK